MSKEYYKLYIENNIQLAETIVVKSERDAFSINEWTIKDHGPSSVDQLDKTSWKYYKNICGEYHATDNMIYITSLDTVSTIAFTKANLQLHPTTKDAYAYDSRYYRELVLENPGKEQLILGILYPANMTHAVDSPDGTILSYPPHLVEKNEVGFINRLQVWISNYLIRWYNLQFNNSHSLYNDAHKAVMHLNMLPEILNLRLRACHTDEVHSFHIREFLASHNGLDSYLDFLDRYQQLWLYRNIRWIERYPGRRETFDWLVQNILTHRSIPLSRFTMRHNVSKLPDEVYPEITFVKSSVNSVYSQDDAETATYSLNRVLEKETPLAPYNAKFIGEQRQAILERFIDSRSNVVQTKMLESSLIDYTDATPYTLQDIAFNHWGYLSQKGVYTAFVRFNNPRTGSEILLNASDAFIYYMFLFAKSNGVRYTNIPKYRGMRVVKLPVSTVSDLMDVVDTSVIETSKAQDLLNSMPVITPLVSVSQFSSKMEQLYNAAQYQLGYVSYEETHTRRGFLQNMVNQLYRDTVIDFTNNTTVNTNNWLAERGLPNEELSAVDCFEMYQVLYESATGITVRTTEQLSSLQRAMLAIMTDLSSYSIQFLANINTSSVTPLNWAVIRPDNIKVTWEHQQEIELPDTTVTDSQTSTSDVLDIDLEPIIVDTDGSISSVNETTLEIPVKVIEDLSEISQVVDITSYNFSIDSPLFETPVTNGPVRYLPSYQEFYDLTVEQRMTIRSIHDCYVRPVANTHIDMADALMRDTLASFKYLAFDKPVLKSFNFIYMPSILNSGIKSVISATLDGVVMTGGRWKMPGMVMLGHESVLDIFIKTNDTVKVDGFKYAGPGLSLPIYAVESLYGVGMTMTPLVIVTEHRTYEFNNTYQQLVSTFTYNSSDIARLTVNNVTDKTQLADTSIVTEGFTTPMTYNSSEVARLTVNNVTDTSQLVDTPIISESFVSEMTPGGEVISESFVSQMTYNSEVMMLGIKYVNDYTKLNMTYTPGDFSVLNLQTVTDNLFTINIYLKPDSFYTSNNSPFFGDRDAIGKPHYVLGSFVIDSGTGKVSFVP